MNFLTNLGASIQFSAFAKQQIQGMHALIDAKQISAEKTEDLFEQTASLERALGEHTYARSLRHYYSARKGLIVIAAVILATALIIYGLSMFGPTSAAIKETATRIMSDFVLFATAVSVVAGLLLIGIIAARLYVRSLEKKLLGKDLSALWARILQRWAPELAANHDVANIAPGAIAQLVAVQMRIQNVSLDLN